MENLRSKIYYYLAPDDYTSVTMTITFPAGTTEFTIPVLTALDEVADMGERFTATLTNPSEGLAVGTDDTATINIIDDTGKVYGGDRVS